MTSTSRRQFFFTTIASAGLTAGVARAAAAETCSGLVTAPETEGPFYPVFAHRDHDADLTQVKGRRRAARGEVLDVLVRVQDARCQPIAGARVELWQACYSGRYDHPDDTNSAALDPNFQYYADLSTDDAGEVLVRTIKPGAYPAAANWVRPPHIHFKIDAPGFVPLTTQMYFAGEALNNIDQILQATPAADQAALVVDFAVQASNPIPLGTFVVGLEAAGNLGA